MYFKKWLMLSLFFYGISTYLYANGRTYLANKEAHEIIQMIKNEYDVQVGGLGGSFFGCRVNMIGFDFDMEKQVYLPEVRKLLLEMKSKICNRVNKNKELLIYLPRHRCGQKNICLSLGFHVKHNRPSEEFVCYAWAWSKIFYCSYDHQNKKLLDLLDESEDEAIEKLKEKGK